MTYKSKKQLSEKEIELIKKFAELPTEEIIKLAYLIIAAKEITKICNELSTLPKEEKDKWAVTNLSY